MRRVLLLAALAWIACRSAGAPPAVIPLALPEPRPLPPARVALISVAGLTPGAYASREPAMPLLARLARAGVAADQVVPAVPGAVYPAHATLVTGEAPARHGVPADHLLGEGGVRPARYSHASFLRVPTLWQRALEAGLVVAAFDWPSTVGAAIDLLISDATPVRRGETWVELLQESSTPWLVEQVRAAGVGAQPGPQRDALLTDLACEVLGSAQAPALLLLRYSQTEGVVAGFGPDSPELRAAFAAVDGELERVLDCLRAVDRLHDTALLVVGDRGLFPVHTEVHPNRELAERGLIARDEAGRARWRAIARSNGGSAFVYARDEASAVEARSVLEELEERTRAFRVVPAGEMLARGADPEAWFALDARPGTVFSDAPGAAVVQPAALRGAGGYLRAAEGEGPGFVAWGQGVRRGVRVPWMRQSDVAPTAAALLRLELTPHEGRALVGALALSEPPPVGASPR